ncbi:hypothetical protein K458DRAFT_442885 [Lentithecium fluviatile CBS 122367]|uniref:Zn(2)-C6 fungal-type domain-containing protein n=1 Tax=Lentithecium fluviatile CBS 122367 TaxID=1168545 RepID=A0A6G1J2U8_9PLEO|nr:hypothetical protein K458DRAFT_442885 [Lentithecium fluviatile CBS 122367]
MRRRPHTKSRKGCLPCKQRHRKCDEAYPRCASCTRLEIPCTWPSSPRPKESTSTGPEHHVSMQLQNRHFGSPDLQSSAASPPLPLDDMRLLHHWTAKTALAHGSTLASNGDRLWSIEVAEVAFEHPFLLHGLLGIAAIHKTLGDPQNDRPGLLAQADAHMSSCLGPYKKNLEQPALETSLPMFLLSSILVTYNLASAQVAEPDNPIDALLHCFRLLRGVSIVIGPHWEQLTKTTIVAQIMSNIVASEEKASAEDGQIEINEVLRLKELVAQLDTSHAEVCIRTIEDLHQVFVRTELSDHPDNAHTICMIWPAQLSETYLDLIAAEHPVAVIILAHFAVLMVRSRHAWYLKGWPKRIVNAAVRILDSTPELQKWLDWPRQHVHVTV